jgi:hypothetical protein
MYKVGMVTITRLTVYIQKWLKGCTRLADTSDKVYQLLAHGRWFSPGTLTSSTSKTGRHDIAEILLKVRVKHQKLNQSIRTFQSRKRKQNIRNGQPKGIGNIGYKTQNEHKQKKKHNTETFLSFHWAQQHHHCSF